MTKKTITPNDQRSKVKNPEHEDFLKDQENQKKVEELNLKLKKKDS